MPLTPASRRASFTSSRRCGLMTATTSFIAPAARLSGGGLLLPRARLPGGRRRRRSLLRLLHARLQRLHEVDDLRLLGLGHVLDLAAVDLGLDDVLQGLPVLVLELLGLEVVGEVLDEALRHLDLLRADLRRLLELGEVGGADLVGPEHRLQDEDVVLEPERAQVLLVPER